MKNYEKVVEIIKEKIVSDYKEDIALLVSNHKIVEEQGELEGFSFYFVSKTEKGNQMSTQFIIDGLSYDLYPMSWNRLISNAAMDSPQWSLFLETEVVYCGDEKALERFNGLKEGLKKVLMDDSRKIRINKAYEFFNESYIYLYNMNRYAYDLKSVRLEGTKLLWKISVALAFINAHYHTSGSGARIKESLSMKILPKDYDNLVDGIIFGKDSKSVYEKSIKLVDATRDLLLSIRNSDVQKEPYETIFTGYYEEIKRYIEQCRGALEKKDYFVLYENGAYLLEEIGEFTTKVCEGVWYDDRNAYCEYNKYFGDEIQQSLLQSISLKKDEDILSAINSIEAGLLDIVKINKLVLLNFDSVKSFEEYFTKNR